MLHRNIYRYVYIYELVHIHISLFYQLTKLKSNNTSIATNKPNTQILVLILLFN